MTRIARPALGVFCFDDGSVEVLDEDLAIGRNPATSLSSGEAPARPVTVPSPLGMVSRTHVVVHLEGWQVQITDRDSTNGTFVVAPGRPEFKLRAGEPLPIVMGSRIRLGDEVHIRYEGQAP